MSRLVTSTLLITITFRMGLRMEKTCPSCLRPLPESRAETPVMDTLSSDSAKVCASCGIPFPRERTETTTGTVVQMDPTEFESAGPDAERKQVAHFQLRQLLGKGGFGTVWLAEDMHLGRLVALKLPKSTQKDAKLLHEAKTAAKLKHPNIVSIFEVGSADDQVYIASEYIDGTSLRDTIHAGRMPIGKAIELLAMVSRAVAHAHKSDVVHRDLKPENILLDSDGKPFVTDFGIAKQLSENETISTDGQILGTVSYMSPEQAAGNTRATDRRSDVYALGTILFELLTEFRPFRGNSRGIIHQKLYEDPPSPRKLVPNLPRDLETICLKCLQREPGKRIQSAEELADELDRFQQGIPIHARPISRMQILWRWCKRNQAVAGLVAGVFVSLSVGLLGMLYFAIQSAHNARMRQEALYRTRMVLASNLWQNGDIKSLKQTLGEYDNHESSGLREYEWHHFTNVLKPYLQITDHGDSVVDVAISNDGDLFASAGRDRIIKVWQSGSNVALRTLEVRAGNVNGLDFSPIDERLISAHADGTVRLWNPLQHDREVRSYPHGPGLVCARFDNSGRHILSVGTDGTVRLWNVASGEQVAERSDLGRSLTDACFAENGQWAAIAKHSGQIVLWDFDSDEIVKELSVGVPVLGLTFVDHDQSIASIGKSNSLAITSLESGSTGFFQFDGNVIGDLEYLPHHDEIAIVSSSASMRLLNPQHNEIARLATHALSPGVLNHSLDGKRIVVGGGDGTVKVLDIDSLQQPEVLWHDTHIRDTAFIDRERVATCLGDGSVHVWNTLSGAHQLLIPPTDREALSIAIGSDNQSLFVSGMFPAILQIDCDSGEEVFAIDQGFSGFGALSFSRDGHRLAVGNRNGAVLIYPLVNAHLVSEPLFENTRPGAQVLDLTFIATSDQVAVAYSDNRVVVYNTTSKRIEHEFDLGTIPQSILCTESGDMMFVGTRSGEIIVVDPEDGPVRSIDAHQGRINALAMFPNGKRMISAGRDQTINVWDTESLERVAILRGHERQIFALAVSPDGECIASAGLAGDLRLWWANEH